MTALETVKERAGMVSTLIGFQDTSASLSSPRRHLSYEGGGSEVVLGTFSPGHLSMVGEAIKGRAPICEMKVCEDADSLLALPLTSPSDAERGMGITKGLQMNSVTDARSSMY